MGASSTTRTRDDATSVAESIHRWLADATGVSLPVRLWDGTELGPPTGAFRLILRHPWSLRSLLLPPTDLAAGESYVFGDIEVEGDVVEALRAASQLRNATPSRAEQARLLGRLLRLPKPPRRNAVRRARLAGRRHSPERDRAAIAFHYDLPQAFYETFLDEELVYSCGYFADDDRSDPAAGLDRAQWRKLDTVCRKLRLGPGVRLLDIGCGWGSLLAHAAKHYGVSGVGVTLSETQVAAGRARLRAAGLDDRVELRLADYRELHETFDAVCSIGMVEHVGPDNLGAYHRKVAELTRPGGRCLTHSIVTGDAERVRRDRGRDFAATYVFPDGGLVPAWRLVRELQGAGLDLYDVEQLQPHYALTLRAWVARLEANREQAAAVTSETDYRIWRIYMAGAAAAFETGDLGVVQVLGGHGAELPLGRSWMLPGDEAPARPVDATVK